VVNAKQGKSQQTSKTFETKLHNIVIKLQLSYSLATPNMTPFPNFGKISAKFRQTFAGFRQNSGTRKDLARFRQAPGKISAKSRLSSGKVSILVKFGQDFG